MNSSFSDWEQSIQQLQRLSVEMFELAQVGEWEAVTDREGQRRAVLDGLFRQSAPDAIAPLLEDAIRATLANDARLVEMARATMDEVDNNRKLIQQGLRAHHAYHDD